MALMDKTIAKRIGLRIRQARQRLEMTQEKLAEQLGVNRLTVVGYESGYRTPHATDLPRLAAVLNVSIEYFFKEGDADSESIP
jgi:transcriptional regulator with XRE-family HTH domain